ncbi:helix-turn-helix domain-containing protein [Bacillus alkalicellulosilyticus]|uniref:helix-turn-helix domain-containing protein n=1 Tax=Alkalihalobacterium alkalicellulosilyticum TaxID=1912214 RepID=UPI0009979F30|nr:helix-turn-helix transcriptional regulator [Bacillus alkalicellulosilyticus]
METINIKLLFGNNVKKYRKLLGLTQEQLAIQTGLHRTYISEVERGLRNVSLENIYILSKALEIKMSDLLTFD